MNPMKKNNSIIIILINIWLISIPFFFECVHASLDDDLMLLFASGKYTNTPSPFLIYSNYLYGLIISSLYKLYNGIEWYSIIQYLLHIIAINIILLNVLLNCKNTILRYAFTIGIVCVASYASISLQYTYLACEVSLASLATTINAESKKDYYWGFILFIIASSIRLSSALIPFMIYLPIIVLPIKSKNKSYRKKICYYSGLLFSCILLSLLDQIIYSSNKEWDEYIKYNNERQYINDNPSAHNAIKIINSSLKKEEFSLLEYRVNDGTILNQDDLSKIVHYLKKKQIDNIKIGFWAHFYTYNYSIRIMLGMLLLSIFLSYKNPNRNILILTLIFCTCLFIIANLYIMSRSRPKEPVILCLATTFISSIYVLITPLIKKKIETVIATTLIIFFSLWISRNIFYTYRNTKTELQRTQNTIFLCEQTKAPKILFFNGTHTIINMYHVSNSLIGRKFLRIGWSINSPHTKQYYHGAISLVKNNIPCIVNDENWDKVLELQKILKSYYNVNAKIIKISERKGQILFVFCSTIE